MGNQRRSDNSHDVRAQEKQDHDHDHEHEHDDTSYAERIIEQRTWGDRPMASVPDGRVKGAGDQDKLVAELETALAANKAADLASIITKMSRETRKSISKELPRMVKLVEPGDALRIADMLQADLAVTLDAVLDAPKAPSLHQMRAYLADVHPLLLASAFMDPARRDLFRSKYAGPLAQVMPQLLDEAAFEWPGIVLWWMESTPVETIARTLLSSSKDVAWKRISTLLQMDRRAWVWGLHVPDNVAIAAAPDVLEAYKNQAPFDDVQKALADKVAVTKKMKPADVKAELRDHKREHLAGDTADELAGAAQAAGMSFDQQIELLLSKSKVTLEDLRVASASWTTDSGVFTLSGLRRIYEKFPDSTPADAFGFVPDKAYRLAIEHKALRPWFVDRAEPIEILRFVTFVPDKTAELCRWLEAHKTGYDWVYKLGGGVDDHLLRRFIIECPDLNVADWVKNHVIADNTKPGGHEVGSEKIDPRAYQGPQATLTDDLERKATAREISADVDQLNDTDAAALRDDTVKLKGILERSDPAVVMRIIERVQPRLRDVLNFAPAGTVRGLAEWIRTRSDADVIEGLGHNTASERAAKLLPALGALELVPQLEKGEVLAQVLLRNPGAITWVMKSEVGAALTVLGSGACAGAAVKALAGHEKLISKLPAGQVLPKPARDGLAQLARLSTGELHEKLAKKLAQEGVDEETEDVPQKQLNVEVIKDTAQSTLIDALETAFEDKPSAEVVLRLCRVHAKDAAALLKNDKLVEKVRGLVSLSPHLVLPGIADNTLMSTAVGRRWMFETVAGHELLHSAMADGKVFEALADALDEEIPRRSTAAQKWAETLPQGKALSAAEKQALHRLARRLTNDASRLQLLGARFGFSAGGKISGASIERIWTTLERIPELHISEGTVQQMIGFDGAGSNTGGEYDNGSIDVRDGMLDQSGVQFGDRQGMKAWTTKQETMQNLGLDEKQFELWLDDHRLTKTNVDGVDKFKLATTYEKDALMPTLLHEVGHGVAHMLGNKSELLFDLAGWKAFSEAEFDDWAKELGGWGSVEPDDQKQIKEAWMMWLSSSRGDTAHESVGDMVRKDHPAVHKKYSGVGVVKLAQDKGMANRFDPHLFGDRAAFVSHEQQRWYTMSKRGLVSAPSAYALKAPAEYFSECYAVYYRDFDGNPKNADQKGRALAPWIKEWFDKNVDNVTHNPRAGESFEDDA